jgi:hypothetical protein
MLRALAVGAVVAAAAATLLTGRFYEMEGARKALGALPALLTGVAVASAMRVSAATVPGRVLWPAAALLAAGSLSLGLLASLAGERSVSNNGLASTPVVYVSMLVATLLGVSVGRAIMLRAARRFARTRDSDPGDLLTFPTAGNRLNATTLHTTDISWLVRRFQRLARRGRRR